MKDIFEFFIVCPIGWEEQVAQQITESRPFFIELNGQNSSYEWPEPELDKGGVSYRLPLHLGLQLNFFSKLASRVLLRVCDFKAQDFPLLKQLLKKKCDLAFWLGPGPYSFKVSAQKSRLNNEKRILAVLEEVFGAAMESSEPAVFVRADNDIFTVSLDCSGAHLHFRGQRQFSSTAPIRETIAYRVLCHLLAERSLAELSEFQFVDFFAGSGTIGYEAISFFDGLRHRDFAFTKWARCPKLFKSSNWQANIKLPATCFNRILLGDLMPENTKTIEHNLQKLGWQKNFKVFTQDFFALSADQVVAMGLGDMNQSLFVFNLPYGERISLGKERSVFLQEVLTKIEELGLLEGILIFPPIKNPKALRLQKGVLEIDLQLSNSGIDVCLYHYKKKQ